MRVDLGSVAGRPSAGRRVIFGSWGSSASQFGMDREARVGPTSFDVAEDGRIMIADQANRRLVLSDGPRRRALSIRLTGQFVDVAFSDAALNVLVLGEGRGGKSVRQYARSGSLVASHSAGSAANNLRMFNGHLYVSAGDGNWRPLDGRSVRGLPTPTGGEVTMRGGRGHRVAITRTEATGGYKWVLRSHANLGVVAVAPRPDGLDAVLVHWTDTTARYQYVELTSIGMSRSKILRDERFAEMTALSIYRFTGRSLYRAASTPQGFAIYRYPLH